MIFMLSAYALTGGFGRLLSPLSKGTIIVSDLVSCIALSSVEHETKDEPITATRLSVRIIFFMISKVLLGVFYIHFLIQNHRFPFDSEAKLHVKKLQAI
ncbi:hypothetical protein AMR72_13070 [Flavobacterium psychrophilum]|nr:hypothetical protein AMR72_13070 [Flavobacterium psychrophilum]AOE53368.1 hypothetical protein ALW18_13060 [Flavobacterium psychrophilum]